MKLDARPLYDLRTEYQDARDGYFYYMARSRKTGSQEDAEWLSYYDGKLDGMERVLRALDLSFDDFTSIVRPNVK